MYLVESNGCIIVVNLRGLALEVYTILLMILLILQVILENLYVRLMLVWKTDCHLRKITPMGFKRLLLQPLLLTLSIIVCKENWYYKTLASKSCKTIDFFITYLQVIKNIIILCIWCIYPIKLKNQCNIIVCWCCV